MKKIPYPLLLSLLLLCYLTDSPAQPKHNLDFELSANSLFPDGWIKWGTNPNIQIDSTQTLSGRFAVLINTPASDQKSFGSIAYQLNPNNYSGKQITLEGFMKIEDVKEGFAGLLLRIDGEGDARQFYNMQDQNIQGTHNWKKYTITLPLNEGAKQIFVAGILTGSGKAWFDAFAVFIDGKKLEDVKPGEKTLSPAELDKTFDNGSEISIDKLTELQHQSLYKLGRIWGFLKYYHPSAGSGNLNWDYELFRILPSILKATRAQQVNKELVLWITKLGTLENKNGANITEKNIKLKPSLEWLSDEKELGKELSELLLAVQAQPRGGASYYISLSRLNHPEFKNEKTYNNMQYSDDGFKILSLFRYWNMIEYFFPYRHLTDKKWHDVLREYIPKFNEGATDELSYQLTLLELIGEIRDTHANLWPGGATLDNHWGRNTAPAILAFVEGQVVINRIAESKWGLASGLRVGDVITHIDGMPVDNVIAQKIKYCPASNLPTQYRNVLPKLLRANTDSLKITIQNEQASVTKTIRLFQHSTVDFRASIPSHKLLDGNIGYVYPGSLQKGEITTIMKDFAQTKGLIIDLRCYPSDFIVFSLGAILNPGTAPFATFTHPSLENPGTFYFDATPMQLGSRSNTDYYKGKVVIIINETTQSSAEYTTMALRTAPNATVIGSTTAGADGNVSEILLPGNIRTMISGLGVYYPDGRETQRVGIIPDIEIKPTIAGIRNNRDELLEKAIDLISK